MKKSVSIPRVLPFLGLALTVCACQMPSAIPSGYVYHSNLYKSPPAAAPEDIGMPWSAERNERAAAHWRVAARSLALQAARGGLSGKTVHLLPAASDDPLTQVFENYLREALMARNVKIENSSGPWPDMSMDLAIVSDNQKAAIALVAPTEMADTAPKIAPDPRSVQSEPLRLVPPDKQTGAPLDLPPASKPPVMPEKAPQPPTKKPDVALVMPGVHDTVAIKISLLSNQKISECWHGVYVVPGVDSYRRPFPDLGLIPPAVGKGLDVVPSDETEGGLNR